MVQAYLRTSTFGFIKLSVVQFPESNKASVITGSAPITLDFSKIVTSEDENITIFLDANSYMCDISLDNKESFKGLIVQHITDTSYGYIVTKLSSE